MKDVFVHSQFSSEYDSAYHFYTDPLFTTEGYGYASNLESIEGSPNAFKLHLILYDEMEPDPDLRVAPFTHAPYQVKLADGATPLNQTAVWVIRDTRSTKELEMLFRVLFGPGETALAYATARPGYESPNGPARMAYTLVFTRMISTHYNIRERTPSKISQLAKTAIGHEVAHHMSVYDIKSKASITDAANRDTIWNTSIMVSTDEPVTNVGTQFHTYHNPEYNLYPQE